MIEEDHKEIQQKQIVIKEAMKKNQELIYKIRENYKNLDIPLSEDEKEYGRQIR